MIVRRFLLAAVLALSFGMAHAGPYNLWMSDDSHASCTDQPRASFNTCPPGIIMEDIRNHLVENKPFKYLAVQLAFDTCRITFSDAGRMQFYDGLVALLTDPKLKKPDKLTNFMGCFDYRSLRDRIRTAMKKAGTESARNRLRTALAALEKWK